MTAFAVLALAGCGASPEATQNKALYTVQGSLLAAQKTALIYLGQPACPAAGPITVACVDPAHKAAIKAASQEATDATDAAVKANAASGSAELLAASAAIAALTASVPQ